jgi:hypothetical protein
VGKLKSIRDKVTELLDFHLEGINQMCRARGDPLAPKGQTLWPSSRDLDELSGAIRSAASLYDRGNGSTWSCILAIQNKRPSLNLQKRIEGMVDRASKLYGELPRAIEIQRQAKEGSAAAEACFKDLQKCFDGQARIMSIKWEKHDAILVPNVPKRETCRDKAAQICIDWMHWNHDVNTAALSLRFWLIDIGNLDLAKKLDYSGSTGFFDEIRERREQDRRKELGALRQREHRLRDKEIKLVREEIEIIDSPQTPKFVRKAVEERLIRHTNRTADKWRRFSVKKA